MKDQERESFLREAKEIALLAGEALKPFWGKLDGFREKDYYWDLVTEADLASEKVILSEIRRRFPNHAILSEEAGLSTQTNSTFLWMVDPLDGTTNFTHQFPMVSISIGLCVDREPLIGVVYNPIHNELFEASSGCGALLNGKKIRVSNVETLERSLLATGFAYDRQETSDNNYAEFCQLTQISQGVRRLGSAALDLAFVASGRLDGYWERGLKPWDIAAGIVLVREAGGVVTSYENGPLDISSGRILATNGKLHASLSTTLLSAKEAWPKKR